jgi:hypothetical protein
MGSPLSRLVANIFMTVFEVEAIDSSPKKPKFWYRYVDDVFAIWPHGQAALKNFLVYLNSRHPNDTLSMELERVRQLAFLDVLVNRRPYKFLGYAFFGSHPHE